MFRATVQWTELEYAQQVQFCVVRAGVDAHELDALDAQQVDAFRTIIKQAFGDGSAPHKAQVVATDVIKKLGLVAKASVHN